MTGKAEGEVAHLEGPSDHLLGVRGAVDVERFGPVVEAHALDQARETEEVVPVEVGDEDPPDPHERGGRLEELPLRPLTAVEEDQLLLHVRGDCARRPLLGGPGAGGAEEGDAASAARTLSRVKGPSPSPPNPLPMRGKRRCRVTCLGSIVVDWDRVEDLRNKGRSWENIADDPKVGFHPDQSVTQAGPALRRLYHRRRSRAERKPQEAPTPKKVSEKAERRWSLARIGYLIVPLAAIWFVVAYLVPSPVGLVLAAIPWIAIILAVGVFLLAFGLLRTTQRWSRVFRTTVILGVVLGLVFVGLISAGGILGRLPDPPAGLFGQDPAGPGLDLGHGFGLAARTAFPSSTSTAATWCPYCSASSWAIWKALTGFAQVTGHLHDVYSGGQHPRDRDGERSPHVELRRVCFERGPIERYGDVPRDRELRSAGVRFRVLG